MTNPQKPARHEVPMSAMEAIYQRRSVRNFTPQTLDPAVLRLLLDAAVQAPTAMHEEPWTFAVIEDQDRLDRLSDSAKERTRLEAQSFGSHRAKHLVDLVNTPDFHVFYHAPALLVIYNKLSAPFATADCWLAAENLMLAACANGLGTCVIGLAISALNTLEWKSALNVPAEMTAVVPIIVGVPAGATPPVTRKPPEIIGGK